MKETIKVTGMHCGSCEVLIEDRLKSIAGIRKVHASTKKQKVDIVSDDNFDIQAVKLAINELGYGTDENTEKYIFSKNPEDYKALLTSIILLFIVYIFAKAFNFENLIRPVGTNGASLPVVFTFGITAGFSTCMAVVGGLVLGVSARFVEKHQNTTRLQKFRPHIFFNLGRILSYTFLGGIIGLAGSAFKISAFGLGAITLVLGFYLLFIGLQVTGIFPRLSSLPTIPKSVAKFFRISKRSDNEYSHVNSMILGALTFFLPCGFTQAMQLYAVSTGSFVSGALIMGAFALGTTPGLLTLGGITSITSKGYFSKLFFKFVGIVVIALSFYNVSMGLNLTGVNLANFIPKSEPQKIESKSEETSKISGPIILESRYSASGKITPSKFTVRVNQPVKLEIYAEDDGSGCMGSVMIPGLVSRPQFYEKGKTVVLEFTPTKKGTYRITCAMGVPSGQITVE